MSHCSSVPYTTPQSTPSSPSAHYRATSLPALSIPRAPPQAPSGSPSPLDPSSGPVRPAPVPGLLSGLFDPTSGAVCHPLAPLSLLGGPTAPSGVLHPPRQAICLRGRHPDPPFRLASAQPTRHSLLLEQHHVASRLGGCQLPARPFARFPAAALPVARPGPAACAPSSWSALSLLLSLRSPRGLLPPCPGLATSRASADAARSSGSAAPRGGGASLRQPERQTQQCALTSRGAEPSRARPTTLKWALAPGPSQHPIWALGRFPSRGIKCTRLVSISFAAANDAPVCLDFAGGCVESQACQK